MLEKKVHDIYEEMKPDEEAKERMLCNILRAPSGSDGIRKETDMKKIKTKHKMQIAASLALLLIVPAAAVCAASFLRLQNVGIGKGMVLDPSAEPGSSSEVKEMEVDLISLQGMSDSPEAKACAEWEAFYEEYDKDGTILSEIGNGPTGVSDEYDDYNCYTQEMADKADEICEKYGLSKLKGLEVAETYEELRAALGIGDVCGGAPEAVEQYPYSGYYHDDGSFHFDGEARIGGGDGCVTDYQFDRSMKGTFSPYVLNVGNMDDYEQWEYTTEKGDSFLLAMSGQKALLVADLEESFVVVNVLGDIVPDDITNEEIEAAGGTVPSSFDLGKDTLEALAESFDLSAIQ